MADITVSFSDGTSHVYRNAPDNITPQQAHERAAREFQGRTITNIDGGRREAPVTVGGVAAEGAKGIVRGASDTALSIGKAGANVVFGPFVGGLLSGAIEDLAAPSRKMVERKAENAAEQFAGTAGEIAGASAIGGGVSGARNLAMTAAASGLGASGEQIGGEGGRIAGTLLPSIPAAAKGVTNLIRSRSQPTVRENLKIYEAAGTEPSVGQATENVFIKGLENLASRFPGSAGILKNFVERQQKSIGRTGQYISGKERTTAEMAGRVIQEGISGKGGFLERTQAVWNNLDNDLARKIPEGVTLVPKNTQEALGKIASEVKGLEGSSRALMPDKIQAFANAFDREVKATGGRVSFDSFRALRTRLGYLMDDAIVSGVPQAQVKLLYKGMSNDMRDVAKMVGAEKEWIRQNRYWTARMDRAETVIDKVLGKNKAPEDVFKAINPKNADEATKLRMTLRSLEPAEREIVTDAVISRMGIQKGSKQGAAGDIFSSEQFLTNWNKMSESSKVHLFPDKETRTAMNAVANASEKIRFGEGLYAGAGAPGSFAAYSVYMSPLLAGGALIAGGPGVALATLAGAGATVGTAAIGAKLLTSKKFVQWLASPIRPADPRSVAAHLARLNQMWADEKDPARKAQLAEFANAVGQTQPGVQPQ